MWTPFLHKIDSNCTLHEQTERENKIEDFKVDEFNVIR